MKGDLSGFGSMWYNPEVIPNILSLTEISRIRRVVFDSGKENTFKVYGGNNGAVCFRQSRNSLYFWESRRRDSTDIVLVNCVKENERIYNKREVKKVKEVNSLSELLSFPSQDNSKSILTHNLIKDCSLTVNDHRRAVVIYGLDLGSVKGKTVRFKPGYVRTNVIVPVPAVILELQG